MKKILFTLLVFLTHHALSAIIPVAGRYDGAGGVYGVAYQEKFKNNQVLLGGVTGDAQAFGGLLTHYYSQNIEFSLGAATFSDVALLTTYQRGLADDAGERYILNLEGQALALGSKIWLFSDLITTHFSGIKSTVKFNSLDGEDGNEIVFDQANLFDIETTSLKIGFDINFYDNPRAPTQGVGLNTSLTQLSGRKGQSDQITLDYGFNAITPFLKYFSFGFKAKYSDALVDKNSRYDSEQEIRDQLAADCSSITSTAERERCEKLEEDLIAYILESNTSGQASPLGGNSGLRSFREQRFKAAHTALYSAEINTNLSSLFNILNNKESKLVFSLFYDLGYANDDKLELFNESKFSNGAALKFYKGRGSVNLQAASGSDNSHSWSLGFGSAF